MEYILIVGIIAAFFVTLFFMPIWIKKAKQIDLVWEDMNKPGFPKNLAGSGGMIVGFSFIFSVLIYIAIKTFVLKTEVNVLEIFVLLSTVTITMFIGFIDDILGWHRGGLSIRFRLILLLLAAIPLMVINAGESKMMGVELGILYPLIFIPLGIIGATATYNFLAGFNGLETTQGIILMLAFAFVTFKTGNSWLSLICLIMVAALIAFYLFNKFPARVLPGDALTYCVGSLIAVIAILGNMEKLAVFFFIPYIIETILKSRGKLKKSSFGKVNEDGSLEVPYEKFYGLEHVAIYALKRTKPSKKAYEYEVVWVINLFQIFVIFLGLIIFKNYLV